ncbi:hypothetical protein NDU88_001813 [Pleurodeles waltl]|uniref:Uncharacterized protein n=1 Tax=Pleurodeles waltl TaxID=8319 RepID=A0AAV7S932_PLEWA|nr:hypothetical protein NDU88_001813 [Pleurodeles waltl]
MGCKRGGSTIRKEVNQEEKFEGTNRRPRKERPRENGCWRHLGPPGGKRTGAEPLTVPIQGRRRLVPGSTQVNRPNQVRVWDTGKGAGGGRQKGTKKDTNITSTDGWINRAEKGERRKDQAQGDRKPRVKN